LKGENQMNGASLPGDTSILSVHLQVADLERSLDFYAGMLGFRQVDRENGSAALSATGSPPVNIRLSERPGAPPKPAHTTGLYHAAIRLPNRRALARLFQRLARNNVPFQGAADHLVSEALYLADPDGNGLELYADRPRDQWPVFEDQIVMTTEQLDINNLLAEIQDDREPWEGIDPGADIGHIHLQVADLGQAEAFYHRLVGLDVTQRTYPGALFLAAGSYHHHIGVNTWASKDASPPPDSAAGLVSFTIHVPDFEAWKLLVERLESAGLPIEKRLENREQASVFVRDPFQIGVELATGRPLSAQAYPPAG
jgi:catechol 2,3-dioxygenase